MQNTSKSDIIGHWDVCAFASDHFCPSLSGIDWLSLASLGSSFFCFGLTGVPNRDCIIVMLSGWGARARAMSDSSGHVYEIMTQHLQKHKVLFCSGTRTHILLQMSRSRRSVERGFPTWLSPTCWSGREGGTSRTQQIKIYSQKTMSKIFCNIMVGMGGWTTVSFWILSCRGKVLICASYEYHVVNTDSLYVP